MSELLLGLAIEAQYICTAALISICALLSAHIYLTRVRKPRGADAVSSDSPGTEVKEAQEPLTAGKLNDGAQTDASPESATVRGRYDKSFTAKLIQASDAVKEYYADLANEFLTYGKVRNRVSWAYSAFYAGRKTLSRFSIRGKTLYLYLALDPRNFVGSKFFFRDESAVRRYEKVPFRLKVRSRRGVKLAKELTEILMRNSGLIRSDRNETVRPSDYPYDTVKNLLKRGLIRLKTADVRAADADRLIWEDFGRRVQVNAGEARSLISDEAAVSLLDEEEESVLPGPKAVVNIDTLSRNYQANDTVTLESLKAKKLVARSVNHVKVLARGSLDKPLTVKMPEFSADAVKMIALTGGRAVRLKTKGR